VVRREDLRADVDALAADDDVRGRPSDDGLDRIARVVVVAPARDPIAQTNWPGAERVPPAALGARRRVVAVDRDRDAPGPRPRARRLSKKEQRIPAAVVGGRCGCQDAIAFTVDDARAVPSAA